MSEGGTYASLRQRYTAALSAGENSLRALLGSSSSSWKPLQTITPKAASASGNEAILSKTEDAEDSVSGISVKPLGPIVIHRKKAKGAPDVVRAICTIPVTNPVNALDSIRAVLSTHSVRDKWDPVVEKEEVLEVVEPSVTLVRTFTRIGWPSSARDIVTVNKFLQDPGKTLIYLSVSLPRSSGKGNDDPPFLQPSPPYVRSHMHICAFVVTCPTPNKAKLSMYWQWDLKGSSVIWTNHLTSMPKIVSSLVDYTQTQAARIPFIRSWGKGVTLESDTFDSMQDRLDLHYGIFVEDAVEDHDKNHVLLEKSKERRRLERTIEISVPPIEGSGAGWNITLPSPLGTAEPPWQVLAERGRASGDKRSRITLRVIHSAPKEDYLTVHVAVQRLAGGKSLKLNGEPLQVHDVEERDPTAFTAKTITVPISPSLAKPAASVLTRVNGLNTRSHASITTATTVDTHASEIDEKVSRAQKDLLLHIRRSYAHFLSLLQSPAAKWRALNEIRRVSISSYIAIDPAMTPIYKYEATFVNTTIWDLLSVFSSNGSRLIWDRQSALERFHFLAELEVDTMDGDQNPNDGSAGEGRASFWEAKWRAIWPTAAREAVFVRTTYRSPTSIHLLQTSVPDDEDTIWRAISDKLSASQEGTFRLHSQLQSVAFDQISPTTTSIVLVDQTNPKSWTKSGYNTMANAIASMGELVLKEGAPPLLTHLSGATLIACSDSHETATCVLKYAPKDNKKNQNTESVLRLDLDVWSPAGASLTINPPPSRISAVARHRLSEKGSGCWISIEHHSLPDEGTRQPISVTVAKAGDSATTGPSERYKLTVNGEKIRVDVEELQDSEIQARRLQKRIVNRAVMLDRSPTPRNTAHFGRPPSIASIEAQPTTRSATPAPVKPATTSSPAESLPVHAERAPLDYAFEALSRLQGLYKETSDAKSEASDWTILSYAENNSPIRISKRVLPSISAEIPLYRVERTLPGVSEDQLLRLIQATSSNMRTAWDDRLSSTENIAQYENGFSTSTWIAQGSFPTRSRISYVASARAQEPSADVVIEGSKKQSPVTYVASSSIPVSAFEQERLGDRTIVATERLNPSRLLEASIFLEGWVIETSSSKKDDDDEESEAQTYTKCSFFTCSELPLMAAGTFGQATLRGRLARIFDMLERLSRTSAHGVIPQLPRPAVHVLNTTPDMLNHASRWGIKYASRNTTVIAALPSTVIIKVHLPSSTQGKARSVQDLDAKSILNGSAISQRSVGTQSMNHQAAGDSNITTSRLGEAIALDPHANDVLLAELVLQRDSDISGYDIRSTTTLPGGKVLPTDTSFWNKLSPVPFVARVYLLSASATSASQYLMRITLPTAQFTSPMEHPLSSLSGSPSLPRWYRKLTSEAGIVHLQATPIRAATRVDGTRPASMRFRMDGVEIPLASDPAAVVFWAEQQSAPVTTQLDELVAVSGDSVGEDVDTASLRMPVVVNTAFLKHAPSRHKDSIQSPGPGSPPLVDEQPPTIEQVHDEANGTDSKLSEKPRQPIADLFTTTTVVQQGVKGQPGSRSVSLRTYRLAFVILVAVISFLLGSLLRSLLSPGDYIFFTRPLDSMEAAVWEILNPQKKWKFATRLLQIPIPGIRRDFVIALVENS